MRNYVLSVFPLVLACNAGGAGEEDGSTSLTSIDPPATASVGTTGVTSATDTADVDVTGTTPVITTDEPEPTTTTIPGGTSESSDGGSDDTTGPVDPTEQPSEPAVHYVGRHDDSDPAQVRMGWSGVGAVFRFNGTDAGVRLDDYGRYFTVVVDGVVQPNLATSPGDKLYPLASGLPAGEHTVELYRRTEGSFGPTNILGVELTGELLAPPPVTRRIEIVGDSITCGYGNEGVSPCNFSAETENHYLTYGAIAARMLGAELSTVAWSGKGVVNNYDKDVFEPLPQIYDRVIATEQKAWSSDVWQADAVVINLGTNDFSTDGDPPENVFVPAYVQLLAHIREVHPNAFILPVAPTLFGNEATMVAGYLQAAVDMRHAAGDLDVAFADVNVQWNGSGCDGHPNLEAHAGMAAKLVTELQTHLGW